MVAGLFAQTVLQADAVLTRLALLFGAYAVAGGLLAWVVSRLDRYDYDRGSGYLLKGLVSMAIGVLACLWTSVTAQALVSLIAAWAILTSVFEVAAVLDRYHLVEREQQRSWSAQIGRQQERTWNAHAEYEQRSWNRQVARSMLLRAR